MPLVSSTALVTTLSLFHVSMGWFLISQPAKIANQGMVFVLGQAMAMPPSRAFEAPSQPLAFLGVVLIFLGLSDLFSLSGAAYPVHLHWSTQAVVRMFLSSGLTAYTFVFSPSGPLYGAKNPRGRLAHPVATHGGGGGAAAAAGYVPSTWGGDLLKNRVFFSWIFLEMMCWFWVFVTLRDERAALQRRQRVEEEEE
jgi:hypothetical protein